MSPRNVQRDGPATPVQRVKQADVLDFLFQRTRLTPTRKPTEARPARAQRPTRNGNLEVNQFLNDRFGLRHGVGPVRKFSLVRGHPRLIMVVYLMQVELHKDFRNSYRFKTFISPCLQAWVHRPIIRPPIYRWVCQMMLCLFSTASAVYFIRYYSPTVPMSHSKSKIWMHVVFSTKDRAPLIAPAVRATVHKVLWTQLVDTGCFVDSVGGVADHVHLLFLLNPKKAIAEVG